jgi:hypothetical protein
MSMSATATTLSGPCSASAVASIQPEEYRPKSRLHVWPAWLQAKPMGKTGLEARLLTPRAMAAGVARELFNRVRRRANRTRELHRRSVTSALQ